MNGNIGLVLSGGGAKGAFQAGVWQAMCNLGFADRIRAISGTSVGAINAAAFAAIRDPEKICSFWRERVEEVLTPNFRALSFEAFCRAIGNVMDGKVFPFHGLLDRRVIEDMIRRLLPKMWSRDVPSVTTTTLECRGGILGELDTSTYRLRRFRLEEEPDHRRRVAKILASAAIPWGFEPVEIDGRRYVDGGWDEKGGENIPLTPLGEGRFDIDTLIVVRCNSRDVDPNPLNARTGQGMRIVEIRPSSRLCGLFDDLIDLVPGETLRRQLRSWSGTFAFSHDSATRFIQQGYADGMAVLRPLQRWNASLNW